MDTLESYPYAEIIDALVKSTMRAQREVVEGGGSAFIHPASDFSAINRHFSWLVVVTKAGQNRHLVDFSEGLSPLGTRALRNKQTMSKKALDDFLAMRTPSEECNSANQPYAQQKRTRIAALILRSVLDASGGPVTPASSKHAVYLQSPLSVVIDFLTVPEMPGTRAYALVACRNYLFSALQLSPALNGEKQKWSFAIRDIETALSHIWTSLRDRYESRGQDKLPARAAVRGGSLVRHFLAMKGILLLWFGTKEKRVAYLEGEALVPIADNDSFEFSRSPLVEKLPDVGELVNEIWGLPIPIRGADTVFRGGLKFSARNGLVWAIHGGPGSGKTSLALALAAYTAPLGITTLFLTAEEIEDDLKDRLGGLIPDSIKRLSFFPSDLAEQITFSRFRLPNGQGETALDSIEKALGELASRLKQTPGQTSDEFTIERPCQVIVILDGLHDLFATGFDDISTEKRLGKRGARLYTLLDKLRELRAFVILTTGVAWAGDSALDYLVDVAVQLSYISVDEYGAKPDRRFLLSKARHQLCAAGTHGLQIAGLKGVRFSPQINYQLERRSIWRTRLPNHNVALPTLRRIRRFEALMASEVETAGDDVWATDPTLADPGTWIDCRSSADVFEGAHIFINGQGSGGKAALALKLALSPRYSRSSRRDLTFLSNREKVLVVSFLYPREYYQTLHSVLTKLHRVEYSFDQNFESPKTRVEVIHLYPGHLRPNDLYNRIEWELEAAELSADPYTSVVIDGVHNVFIQFPEIEKYHLFWPQIYSLLRSRSITTISTHATLALPFIGDWGGGQVVDDARSEPLRHALVQKMDFQLEVDPYQGNPYEPTTLSSSPPGIRLDHLFVVKTASAIGQRIPRAYLLWSRERMVLYDFPERVFEEKADPEQLSLELSEGRDASR